MLEETGYVDIEIGAPIDTFAGSRGEEKARIYDVHGYSFRASSP